MPCENVSTGNLPADAQHAGGFDFLLACRTDFRQNQMPRVTADFVIVSSRPDRTARGEKSVAWRHGLD
jgi:hypothetical protein